MTDREKRHTKLCKILHRAKQNNNWSGMLEILDALPSGVTLLKIAAWIERYSDRKVVFKDKRPVELEKKEGVISPFQAKAHPYWRVILENKEDYVSNSGIDLEKINLNSFFKNFRENPNEKNYLDLLFKLREYKSSHSVTKKNKHVRIVQGGSFGLGKSRKH